MSFMSFIPWADPKKIDKLDYVDIALIKIGAIFFTLMIAKLWEQILILDWYWYAIVFLIAVIRPLNSILKEDTSSKN